MVGRLLRSQAAVAVGMVLMSIANYVYNAFFAARSLDAANYGAFMALMNLMMIASVTTLGVQATAARRIAADPQHVGLIERDVLRVTNRLAYGLGIPAMLVAPIVQRGLDLETMLSAALVGASIIPMTIMGAQLGILQGEQRWAALAWVYIWSALPRIGFGVALMFWQPNETFAVAGAALSWIPAVVAGGWALRRHARPEPDPGYRSPSMVREMVHNSQAILAFLIISNIDLILARNVLDPHDSGLYSAGAIVVRTVLYLPQFVVVVAFPSMSAAEGRLRALLQSLMLVGVLGGLGVAGVAVLPDLAMALAGGPTYAEMRDDLWAFAILGTVLSALQVIVYSVMARSGRVSTYLVWVGVAALTLLSFSADTPIELLVVVLGVDAVLTAVLLGISLVTLRRQEAAAATSPGSPGSAPAGPLDSPPVGG